LANKRNELEASAKESLKKSDLLTVAKDVQDYDALQKTLYNTYSSNVTSA